MSITRLVETSMNAMLPESQCISVSGVRVGQSMPASKRCSCFALCHFLQQVFSAWSVPYRRRSARISHDVRELTPHRQVPLPSPVHLRPEAHRERLPPYDFPEHPETGSAPLLPPFPFRCESSHPLASRRI